ncbi:MAG: hypothetical protein EPO22_05090 [Dehalococcoidia bacterium]|nr:MAG: hypothetical protein EPO22_05090 [Dehalococcoidia bacterium]
MSTQSLTDDLLSIACASRPGEMRKRLDGLLSDASTPRETVASETRRVIGLLRLQAKSMEQMPPANLTDDDAARLGLRDWVASTRARAAELRTEADEFERAAVAAGLLAEGDMEHWSARGLLRGVEVSEEDIADAKRSLFGGSEYDNGA